MYSLLRKRIQHVGLLRYGFNTLWMMFEKLLRMSVGLLVTVWVARYLEPQVFGLLNYALSLVFIFTAFASLGLDGIVVRELVKNNHQRDIVMGTSFVLKVSAACITLIAILIFTNFSSMPAREKLLVVVIGSSSIFLSLNVIDFYYQATLQSKFTAIAYSITLLITSLLKAVCIFLEFEVVAFALISVIDAIILVSMLYWFYRNRLKLSVKAWRFSLPMAAKLMTSSWPLIISSVIVSISMKVDQVMLGYMVNSTAVGYYAAAARLSEAWYFIPVLISSSLFPAIVAAKERDLTLFNNRTQRLYSLLVLTSIAVSLPISIFSPTIINILYGPAYMESAIVLTLHIWAMVFVSLTVASGKYLIAVDRTRTIMYRNGAAVVANVILNLLFIPTLGAVGAAIALLASWTISGILFDIFDRAMRSNLRMKLLAFGGVGLFKGGPL